MLPTPYEQTGTLTSIEDGEDFCEMLAAAHPHVTLQKWGPVSGIVTRLGQHSVTVGAGPVGVAVMAAIHGNEVAGREAAFAFARDLAATTDPAVHAYLGQRSVTIMPTANMSGVRDNTRNTSGGVNLNRTYSVYPPVLSDMQALMGWLEWGVPTVILDMHQMGPSDSSMQTATATTLAGTDEAFDQYLRPLGVALDADVASAVQAAGYTYEPYLPMEAGTLRESGARRFKAVAQLLETNWGFMDLDERIDACMAAQWATLANHQANVSAYDAAHLAAGGDGNSATPVGASMPPLPPEDPGDPGGLLTADGDPVTLARTNGDPVSIT